MSAISVISLDDFEDFADVSRKSARNRSVSSVRARPQGAHEDAVSAHSKTSERALGSLPTAHDALAGALVERLLQLIER